VINYRLRQGIEVIQKKYYDKIKITIRCKYARIIMKKLIRIKQTMYSKSINLLEFLRSFKNIGNIKSNTSNIFRYQECKFCVYKKTLVLKLK